MPRICTKWLNNLLMQLPCDIAGRSLSALSGRSLLAECPHATSGLWNCAPMAGNATENSTGLVVCLNICPSSADPCGPCSNPATVCSSVGPSSYQSLYAHAKRSYMRFLSLDYPHLIIAIELSIHITSTSPVSIVVCCWQQFRKLKVEEVGIWQRVPEKALTKRTTVCIPVQHPEDIFASGILFLM